MVATLTLPRREEVAKENTWNIESIFNSPQAWEQAYQSLEQELPTLEPFKGHLADSAAQLLRWLETTDQLAIALGKLFVYASMAFDVDSGNQANAALVSRMYGLAARFGAATSFARPELLAIDKSHIDQFVVQEPKLKTYTHFFDDLQRQRPHVRSAEVEEVLAQVSDVLSTPWNTYQMLADADLKFGMVEGSNGEQAQVARGTIGKLLSSPDRTLRKNAWNAYADGFISVKNTMASNMAGNVKANVFRAQARGYEDALTAATDEFNIPTSVFNNVIDACNRHLPIWHRYWDIRRRALGLEKLESCDIFAPLVKQSPEISYTEAIEQICAGMSPLGVDYTRVLRDGLTKNRWVDPYPNQGKRNGAYSTGSYGTQPFILMSYNHRLEDMSVLAHELGHSMHSWLTYNNQPFVYSGYSIFVAEIASNFNQAMVRHYLLQQNSDRDFQIAIIEEAMSNFHRYLFIMPILAQYELHIHQQIEQGQALTADAMSDFLADLFSKGYGPAMQVDRPREGITWAQFGHMYANFYVYQYASGIAAANALADAILSGEQGATDRYLQFLKAGNSLYPLEAVKVAGIDLTSPEPMDRAFKVLEGFVDRLEKLL